MSRGSDTYHYCPQSLFFFLKKTMTFFDRCGNRFFSIAKNFSQSFRVAFFALKTCWTLFPGNHKKMDECQNSNQNFFRTGDRVYSIKVSPTIFNSQGHINIGFLKFVFSGKNAKSSFLGRAERSLLAQGLVKMISFFLVLDIFLRFIFLNLFFLALFDRIYPSFA